MVRVQVLSHFTDEKKLKQKVQGEDPAHPAGQWQSKSAYSSSLA